MSTASNSAGSLLVAAMLLNLSCEHGKNTAQVPEQPVSPSAGIPAAAGSPDAAKHVPKVELADSPRIDLLSNHYRWHLYADGLVIPFASEGVHKYSHEYRRPFGPVVEHDGRSGRVMRAATARLKFPYHSNAGAALRLFAHGLIEKQSVEVVVNGTKLGRAALANSWQQSVLIIPPETLREGENEIQLRVKRATRIGSTKSYALWHAAEIVMGESQAAQWPAVDPLDGDALRGFKRMSMVLEVPDDAWLIFESTGPARVRANSRPLFEGTEPGQQRVDLSALAGKLVVLEFESEHPWRNPTIALTRRKSVKKPAFENAVLIVVDALRADRLALYGKTRVQTPRFTTAADHAAVFLNNQAASPSSPPSHTSIQTGMIPRVHGIAGDKGKLKAGIPTISSQLGAAGIATAYVGNNSFGMSRLRKAGKWTKFTSPLSSGQGPDCEQVVEGVLAFAAAQKKAGKRFFVSALPMEPHAPYRYHKGISDKYHDGAWKKPLGKRVTGYTLEDIVAGRKKMNDGQWSQLRALYDGEVEHMDACFGMLEDGLAALGLSESTAIVVTADHGEGMGERARLGHAYGHFGELSNVPFIVYAPGFEGPRNVDTVTGHVDIAPTVLSLLGVVPDARIQGESVLNLMMRDGSWTPRVMSVEYGKSYALRSRTWKLIVDYSGTERLFDASSDPLDSTDVAADNPLALRYMRDMSGFFLEHRSSWKIAKWGTLNNHTAGYAQ